MWSSSKAGRLRKPSWGLGRSRYHSKPEHENERDKKIQIKKEMLECSYNCRKEIRRYSRFKSRRKCRNVPMIVGKRYRSLNKYFSVRSDLVSVNISWRRADFYTAKIKPPSQCTIQIVLTESEALPQRMSDVKGLRVC